jgi:chromosomal replication initiation ATPase DnaA
MTGRPEQLPLDLPIAPRTGLADWVVSEVNRTAFELVMRWPDWPSPVVIVVGPEGSGKSHLAGIFAERSGARIVTAGELATIDPIALAGLGPVVVEDLGAGLDERALFHLFNATAAAGVGLLVTARTPPTAWELALPDLASRLRAALAVELGEPDDRLLEALLEKLFADRQTRVEPNLLGFLARRMERSFAAAHRLVEALDRAALAAKTPITRGVAARVLAEGFDGAPRLPGLDDERSAREDDHGAPANNPS